MLTDLFNQSFRSAQEIFEHSENICDVPVRDFYRDRSPFWRDVIGVEGYTSFTPFVKPNLTLHIVELFEDELPRLRNLSMWGSEEEAKTARRQLAMISILTERLSDELLISNQVPEEFSEYVKRKEIKGYSSPKLSKALVKIFGETSEVVRWYTCVCPKEVVEGFNEDYRIYLTALPHHIAGMSYYAPLNVGGKKWVDGWSGTSCVDPTRNGDGEGVYSLVPSLMDESLAVAYLTEKSYDDIHSPRMEARALVRMVRFEDGREIMLACRPFFTSFQTRHILLEGLKSQFPNLYTVKEIREHKKLDPFNEKVEIKIKNAVYTTAGHGDCDFCCGGVIYLDGEDVPCTYCDGEGFMEVDEQDYYPYIDDDDIIDFEGDRIYYHFPRKFLQSIGVRELVSA